MYTPSFQDRTVILKQGRWHWLALALVLSLLVVAVAPLLVGSVTVTGTNVQVDLGNLPLPFVPNVGQTDTAVKYQVHDMGGTVFFTEEGVAFTLPVSEEANTPIWLRFQDANPAPAVAAGEALPGTVNYLVGADANEWHTGVPTYDSITYQELYPGIDLHYDGVNGRIKGTYTVAPGANPGLIRWYHEGAVGASVAESGNLIIQVPGANGATATLVEEAPTAWQEINGQQVPVTAQYAVNPNGTVGFALGDYNPAYPLIIDPTLVYSSYLGGTNFEDAEGIAVDAEGNAYVTGTTNSADFPTKSALQSFDSNDDAYIAKINADGDGLLFSTFIGGSEDEMANDLALDADGNVIIVGETDSEDYPVSNAIQDECATSGGSFGVCVGDAFVTALSADGSSLLFSTYMGGEGVDEAEGVAVGSDGAVYLTGYTASGDFPTANALYDSAVGDMDAFVAKLSAGGSSLLFSTYLGSSEFDAGVDIAVDAAGNAYVVGDTFGAFPTTNGVAQSGNAGGQEMFIAKLLADGSDLSYSTFLGGSGDDSSFGIAVDAAGNAYAAGQTSSNDFPTTTGVVQDLIGGEEDGFVAKLNADGADLVYSTYLGGSDMDNLFGIAVDDAGSAYVVGDTFSDDFPTASAMQTGSNGDADAIVAKLNADGTGLAYSTYLGGTDSDHGDAVALDGAGNAFVAGLTGSTNFPTEGAFQGDLAGVTDVFVAKISDQGNQQLPSPDPDPEPDPTPIPEPGPSLIGSAKYGSQLKIAPGEVMSFTISLHNNGSEDAVVDVVDELPSELIYVNGSASDGANYNAGPPETLTWTNITVPATEHKLLTFEVMADGSITSPTIVENTAVITPEGEDDIERNFAVFIVPGLDDADLHAPEVNDVTIDDKDVLDSADVTVHIDADDDMSVEWMFLREWQLSTTPFPHWEVAQSSGWVPFESDYDWTLGDQSGVHFVGVWVADAAFNRSHPTSDAFDYASLLLPDTVVDKHHLIPYMVHYEAGVDVTATLTPSFGDPDLYVWRADDLSTLFESSTNNGTAVDEVSFNTAAEDDYIFLVYGHEASKYDLAITPAGGGAALTALDSAQIAPANAVSKTPDFTVEPLFSQAGLQPAAANDTPGGPHLLYLPMVFNPVDVGPAGE